MISELQGMIDVADATDNQKAKIILLKIAELKEDKQEPMLQLVKMMLEARG